MFPVTIQNCYLNDNGSSENGVTVTIDLDRYNFKLKGNRPDLWKHEPSFVRILLPKSFEGISSMEELKIVCDMKGLTINKFVKKHDSVRIDQIETRKVK